MKCAVVTTKSVQQSKICAVVKFPQRKPCLAKCAFRFVGYFPEYSLPQSTQSSFITVHLLILSTASQLKCVQILLSFFLPQPIFIKFCIVYFNVQLSQRSRLVACKHATAQAMFELKFELACALQTILEELSLTLLPVYCIQFTSFSFFKGNLRKSLGLLISESKLA